MEKYPRPNRVADVPKRKVPKRLPDYLRPDEVPPLLASVKPKWRALFAMAIYTGLRKSELFALRKTDVDLAAGIITVCRSHDRDTPKKGRADAVPTNSELLAHYLQQAIRPRLTAVLMCGADLAAVQRIMRHQDPRMTTEFYGHLAAHYLKREVERLHFGPPAGDPATTAAHAATSPPQVPQEPQSLLAAGGDPQSPLPAVLARADAQKAAPFTTRHSKRACSPHSTPSRWKGSARTYVGRGERI